LLLDRGKLPFSLFCGIGVDPLPPSHHPHQVPRGDHSTASDEASTG
jgi:hypothetical protein